MASAQQLDVAGAKASQARRSTLAELIAQHRSVLSHVEGRARQDALDSIAVEARAEGLGPGELYALLRPHVRGGNPVETYQLLCQLHHDLKDALRPA